MKTLGFLARALEKKSIQTVALVCMFVLCGHVLYARSEGKREKQSAQNCHKPDSCCDQLHTDLAKLFQKVKECCASQTTCCSDIQTQLTQLETTITNCCNASGDCCASIRDDIAKVQRKLDSCCVEQKVCCTNLGDKIDLVQTTLNRCCVDQALCCEQIQTTLARIEALIAACCNGGGGGASCCGTCCFITEIPPEGLILDKPCHYIVLNDLFFDGGSSAVQARSAAALQDGCPPPVVTVNFGITITSDNVFLDFNNHTYTIAGENVGGVAVVNGVANSQVSGGVVVGNNAVNQVGVAVTSAQAVVSNVAFVNVGVSVPAVVSVVSVVSVVGVVGVAGAVVVAPVVAVVVGAEAQATAADGTLQQTSAKVGGIIVENISSVGSANGITIQGPVENLIIRDVFIKDSQQMGITQPSRSGSHGNFLLENVMITNSRLNGIYTTFNQDNWTLKNVQIRNSGLNGALFVGFQNLTIQDSQIAESGAKGLVASIRQSQNIALSGLEIFNAKEEALRIDNVQNLSLERSKFINYEQTTYPLVKIQDVNNGLIAHSEFMSLGGAADGLFIRNSHGLILETNLVKVLSNVTSTTPVPQPPLISGNTLEQYIQFKYCDGPALVNNDQAATGSGSGNIVSIAGLSGINLHGGVTATQIRNTVISGTPDTGIALQADTLNGTDEGVIIENVLVDGAQLHGILFSSARNSAVLGSQVLNGQGDGITIDTASSQAAVRNNTLTNNRGFGIRNKGINAQIYQNFAAANGRNYSSNILSAAPSAGLGSLENISS